MREFFTVLFKDSVTLCSEYKELMAHDQKKHTEPMKDKFVFIKSGVLLMCKLKYKCIFM